MAAETAAIAEESPAAVPAPAPPAAEPAKAKAKAEKSGKGKAEKGKAEKAAKGKKDAKGAKVAAAAADGGPSLAGHPRAVRGVAHAKSWGALIGFLLGGYLALPTMTLAEAGARALMAGIVCYLAAWAGAVFVWRRLVVIELKGKEQELAAAHAAALARAQLPGGPPPPNGPTRAG
jgi:hypothetical protein